MANRTASATKLTLAQARACWMRRQGLNAPLSGSPVEIVRATGWPRTLGGIDVYLSLFARSTSLRREDLDQAVKSGELRVVPAVRSCIYVVPRAEVPLVLRIAEELWRPRTERELSKVGSTWNEVNELAEAALAVLKKTAHTPDSLRKALPAGILRSLGEVGKKVGMSSVLPVALRLLEFDGRLERTILGSRLDSERYVWRAISSTPGDKSQRSVSSAPPVATDPQQRFAQLAAIFFLHAAPATPKEFAEWAGLPLRDAKVAVQSLDLVPMAIEGHADHAFAYAEDLKTEQVPANALSLLSFSDNYLTYHGGLAPLCDPAEHGRGIPVLPSTRGSTLGDAKHIHMRPILSAGQVVGFWEYDPDAKRVVAATFSKKRQPAALAAAVERLSDFLRLDLGHGRSFSLDTDEALRQRTALVSAAL